MVNHSTRASLLIQLRDRGDSAAWSEFVAVYMPLLHSYAIRSGLQDSDAADLAQETIRQVIRSIDRFQYAPEHGSFRGWLLTIARNLIRRQKKRESGSARGAGDSAVVELLQNQPTREEADVWESDYQKRLFEVAVHRVQPEFRESTWQAFWLTTVEGQEAAGVAQKLSLSTGAVYIARSRVLARLREEVARLSSETEEARRHG